MYVIVASLCHIHLQADVEEDVEADEDGLDQLPSMNMSGPTLPQSPESSRAVPALVSNKRKTDAQSAKSNNAVSA